MTDLLVVLGLASIGGLWVVYGRTIGRWIRRRTHRTACAAGQHDYVPVAALNDDETPLGLLMRRLAVTVIEQHHLCSWCGTIALAPESEYVKRFGTWDRSVAVPREGFAEELESDVRRLRAL